AKDLARFSRMMLNQGKLDGRRLFRPATVKLMTSVQSAPGLPRRGFGWDIDSPYAGPRGAHFPIGSYGHTGWTGGSLWLDPFSGTFVIFLSNRNHPTEDGNVIGLRRQLGTLAAEAVTGFDFAKVQGALLPEPAVKR
ncbi:MAG TPA: serine hydrolase, partial [Candidatus Limnocylindria bacterium]|nr:serine hydrolase [Candidatus Limnocylindria bacterium]